MILKTAKILFGILLLYGVVSCSFVEQKEYNIKIIDIPENISQSEFDQKINKFIKYLTTEPLHTPQISLLDELYFDEGKLHLSIKKGIHFHNGHPLTSEQIIENLKTDMIITKKTDLQFEIEYSQNQRAKLDSFFSRSIDFYPSSSLSETYKYFIGTGKYYLTDITDNQISLKKFNAHRDNQKIKYTI